jgi:hypothetical protein
MENINVTLDKAIGARDFRELRDALVTYIVQDPGCARGVFDGKVGYCLQQGITEGDLFEAHNGVSLESDASRWTKEYHASLCTEFRANFSKERLAHLKLVGKKVYSPVAATTSAGGDVKKNSPTAEARRPPEGQAPGRLILVAGIVAVALVTLVITCVVSSR